jgi:hypothetical protein
MRNDVTGDPLTALWARLVRRRQSIALAAAAANDAVAG